MEGEELIQIQQHDFIDITYLKSGNQRQKSAYTLLKDLQLMDKLSEFDPILAGTIPLGIDLPGSDLDVICYALDLAYFKRVVTDRLNEIHNLECSNSTNQGMDSLVVQFTYENWSFELFAQSKPTAMQNGYKHMIVEHRILTILNEEARESIIKLKQAGIKTEPAFAKLLGLEGNPYERLLEWFDWPDDKLRTFVMNHYRRGGYFNE